ncbi:MAG: hypothetical protein WCR19_01580 [Acholeplasmataceae bacterium]
MIDIIGYIASAIVLVSLLMSSVIKLRIINLVGSLAFAFYGFLIPSIPTAVMNLGIVVINIYYLVKLNKAKEKFSVIELDKDSKLYLDFVDFYKDDIVKFMKVDLDFNNPKFKKYFITRNTIPAGLFIGEMIDDYMKIHLDYTTPTYRDYKAGKYLYSDVYQLFKDLNVTYLTSDPGQLKHESYLLKMGFKKIEIDHKIIMKKLLKNQK